jgi:hypothetical protein
LAISIKNYLLTSRLREPLYSEKTDDGFDICKFLNRIEHKQQRNHLAKLLGEQKCQKSGCKIIPRSDKSEASTRLIILMMDMDMKADNECKPPRPTHNAHGKCCRFCVRKER